MLVSQKASEASCLCPPGTGTICAPCLAFHLGSVDQTEVLMCTQQVPHQMNHFPIPSCIFISKKKDLRVLEVKHVKQGHQASPTHSEHMCQVFIFSTELSRSHCFFYAYEYRMFLLFQSLYLITLAYPCLSDKMMPSQVSEVKYECLWSPFSVGWVW